jgi:asparagine synthase (glutamine-hydrolysing)
MSGFVGVFARDGRPVDAAELDARVASIAFRGPDGTHAWRAGAIGLGHARFVTDPARDGDVLPLPQDGLTLVGDIRLDISCHPERSEGSPRRSDALLVLDAYRQWGPACVEHLHGDFSFAIWDEREQRVFCARDRFGVRPLFYAPGNGTFAFTNTLECLRRDRRIDQTLDELAIADYLVSGHLREAQRTFFANIRRLPPAHTLVVTARELVLKRYWSLPVEPELRHRDPGEYVGQFNELLARAVADRTPAGAVALRLSGGLDSGCIGAALAGRAGAKAFCVGWNSAFDDPEPGFARISAQALGLPLAVHEEPDCEPLKGWDDLGRVEPEPSYDIYRRLTVDALAQAATHARVVLDGQGGDEVFQREYWLDEWRRAPRLGLLADAWRTYAATGTRPALGLRHRPHAAVAVPEWIDARWRQAHRLDDRARTLGADEPDRSLPHGQARAKLGASLWPPYLESHDAALTRVPVEVRWPLLDERIVRFALSLPPFPWSVRKHLQRQALRGRLPPAITEREKAPLADDPLGVFLERHTDWLEAQRWTKPWLAGRVDYWAWKQSWQQPLSAGGRWARVRATALAHWLRTEASPLRAP